MGYFDEAKDELAHHGIQGQKWGVRRFQTAAGKLTAAGKERLNQAKQSATKAVNKVKYGKTYDMKYAGNVQTKFGKTKYTNLDGTLNEKGKVLASNFSKKEVERNNKYYDKQIKKYREAAEAMKDDKKLASQYKKMAKSAEQSREETNKNLKNMSLDQILEVQQQRNQRNLALAGGAAGLVGASGLIAAALNKDIRTAASDKFMNFNPYEPMQRVEAWTTTPVGAKSMSYVDAALRSYSDVRAYAVGTAIDQSMTRLDRMGVPERAGKMIGSVGKTAAESSNAANVVNAVSTLETEIAKKIKEET